MSKRIFFSAGEPSGDLHAAELISEIKKQHPDWECVGLGGPEMAKAGCVLQTDLTQLAIMWLGRALLNLRTFYRIAAEAEDFFKNNKVDAVVLVDYPGFNWHIAKRAKRNGIPVFYFMPPQIWSWGQWRAAKMRKLTDHVLCSLPFEKIWFESKGCNVHWIGHPFFEEVKKRKLDNEFLNSLAPTAEKGPILTLLPGSRTQEVHVNFADFLKIVKRVRKAVPNVQPVVAAFKESQALWIRNYLKSQNEDFSVIVNKTPELIHASKCCLAVSGSVSLELLANAKPSVIYYRVGYIPFFIQRFFRRTRFITLVNMLNVYRKSGENLESFFYPESCRIIPAIPCEEDRNKMLFPEFLTWRDESEAASQPLIQCLKEPDFLAEREKELKALLSAEYQGESPIASAAAVLAAQIQ